MLVQRMPRRDLQALERRRKQAARLFAKSFSQASIAREVKVSRMSVSRWYRQWKQSGKDALKAAPRAGRKPLLNSRDVQRVRAALSKGARAHGFSADLWTLPRVDLLPRRNRIHPATLGPPDLGSARGNADPESPRQSLDQNFGSGSARVSLGWPKDAPPCQNQAG